MRLIIVLFVCLLACSPVFAAPALVSDPQSGVTHYRISGDPFWTEAIPAQADGSLRSDLAGIAVGDHNLQVKACRADTVWGEACSAPVPFSFTRPIGPIVPSGLMLAP
jgi:hypothetical protein